MVRGRSAIIMPRAQKRVTVEIQAWLVEEFPDGSATVDADGIEIPVEAGEWGRSES